jgi:hypothetical protein
MSNKRITDLTELTTPTTDDVFPVVDIATNTTTKVQLANLPVQTAVTTALATKQATLVSGTNIKTVNSTTLLGSGDVAVQETLVSGTNIKTINSTSLLGSGNITIAANPSGVSGAIQFSNGSAFASDATNFFWDDTNNRLGIGTNSPSATAHFKGSGSTSATTSLLVQNSAASTSLQLTDDGRLNLPSTGASSRTIVIGGGYIGFRGDTNKLLGIEAGGFVYYDGTNRFQVGNTGDAIVYGELNMNSTTKGFLPPRMTTTQRNAIASPAAGLVVYDSTTNKLQCYNGSTWNDLF